MIQQMHRAPLSQADCQSHLQCPCTTVYTYIYIYILGYGLLTYALMCREDACFSSHTRTWDIDVSVRVYVYMHACMQVCMPVGKFGSV